MYSYSPKLLSLSYSALNTQSLLTASLSTLSKEARKIKSILKDIDAKVPPKPPRPVTAYQLFVKERAEVAVGTYSMKEVGREWKSSNQALYQDKVSKHKEEYAAKKQEYEDSLNEESKKLLKQQKEMKKKIKAFAELESTNPPSKPLNSFAIFTRIMTNDPKFKEQLAGVDSKDVLKTQIKIISEQYKILSDEQRDDLAYKSEKSKKEYQEKLKSWHQSVQNDENLSKEAKALASAYFYKSASNSSNEPKS